MSDAFTGEIKIFGGRFAIRNWAFCDGQLLPISQNPTLFSIIGTTYGGDGYSTMGLPNLMGRAPMHAGTGPGLSYRRVGQMGGAPTVTLQTAQMPSHDHRFKVADINADTEAPSGNSLARGRNEAAPKKKDRKIPIYNNTGSAGNMGSITQPTGNNSAHNNMQPSLAMNFIICLDGVYPSRS